MKWRSCPTVNLRNCLSKAIESVLVSLAIGAVVTPIAFPAKSFAATVHEDTSGDYGIALVDRNVHLHTAEVKLNNGYTVKVDTSAGKVYIRKGLQTETFELDYVLLQAASGNAQLAAQRRAELVSKLSTPIGNARLNRLNPSTANEYAKTPANALMPPNSTYAPIGYHSGFNPIPIDGSIGDDASPFTCDFHWPCRYEPMWGNNLGLGSGEFGFWSYDNPPSTTPPSQDPDDYGDWDRWRRDHCGQASDEWKQGDINAAAFGVSLAAAETGVGLIAAAITGVATIYSGIQATGDQRTCDSQYPGPGHW